MYFLYRSLYSIAFHSYSNACLSRVSDSQRDDGPAVGVGLEVRVTAFGDPREQVAGLVYVYVRVCVEAAGVENKLQEQQLQQYVLLLHKPAVLQAAHITNYCYSTPPF